MATRYESGKPFRVSIGAATEAELPPRVFQGRLLGMLYDVDKTFLLPSAMRGIRELVRYYERHPGMHLLIVGHTDSTGSASYNVSLSKERAASMAAFLRDEVEAWLGYYQAGKPAGKPWGTLEDQHMLSVVAAYQGNLDGKAGPRTEEAVRRFQESAGLPVNGKIDAATRKQLVTKYMAQDTTTLPADATLTTHGAGPHHPDAEGSDPESLRKNRRVEIFLSDGPIEPAPGAPDGPEYDSWVTKSTEVVDFTDAPEELVELDLEWPADVIERLPDDLILRVSGPTITTQEKKRAAAEKAGEMRRFPFRWIDRASKVDLVAVHGAETLTLWKEQVPGDLETPVVWEARLEELITPPPDDDGGDSVAIRTGGLPDDERIV